MKPGKPLERRTALARGPLPLGRKAPLARQAMKRAPRQPAERPQDGQSGSDWSTETRDVVLRRCGGFCEVCGSQRASDLHHRKRRREGDHRAINALAACRGCHGDVHGSPADSRGNGWIVSAWGDPATVAMLVNGNRWVLLTDDGGYRTDQRGWPA